MTDTAYDACAWGSHLPVLLGCLGDTVGSVLEVGVGHFSTPALHAFCEASGRPLVSLEQDKTWHDQFKAKYGTNHHKFRLGEYDDEVPMLSLMEWGVALIDNSPGGTRRANDFADLINRSIYVVVHDYHKENEESISPMLQGLNFHVAKSYQPPTLVASRSRKIPEAIKVL